MNKKKLLALLLGVYIFMATIVIPSKHIYDMMNEKVIDNQIDKVEVPYNAVKIINGTENVYNISYDEPFVEGEAQDNIGIGSILNVQNPVVAGTDDAFFAYVSLKPTYITKYIEIPKTIDNARIVKLLTGASKETGSPIISVSFFGTHENGITTARAGGLYHYYDYEKIFSIKDFSFEEKIVEDNISYTLPNVDEEVTERYNSHSDSPNPDAYTWAVAKVKLQNEDNLLEATASQNEKSFGIELKILCGIEIIKIGATVPAKYNTTGQTEVTIYTEVSGTYERYIPKQVRISFEGDIIKLDLEENTITIGDGNNVISFTGNELIHGGNVPPVEYTYDDVIAHYKNGKETATIRCGIENYYDINGNKVISKGELPMTFHIGDRVIPYVYGANGKDKPMSLKKDGSPKEFNVVGKNMIYDGAILQELVLQEHTDKKENDYAVITITQRRAVVGSLQLDCTLDFGTLEARQIIEYEGEEAVVAGETGQGFRITTYVGGTDSKFYNTLGKTITVKKTRRI